MLRIEGGLCLAVRGGAGRAGAVQAVRQQELVFNAQYRLAMAEYRVDRASGAPPPPPHPPVPPLPVRISSVCGWRAQKRFGAILNETAVARLTLRSL